MPYIIAWVGRPSGGCPFEQTRRFRGLRTKAAIGRAKQFELCPQKRRPARTKGATRPRDSAPIRARYCARAHNSVVIGPKARRLSGSIAQGNAGEAGVRRHIVKNGARAYRGPASRLPALKHARPGGRGLLVAAWGATGAPTFVGLAPAAPAKRNAWGLGTAAPMGAGGPLQPPRRHRRSHGATGPCPSPPASKPPWPSGGQASTDATAPRGAFVCGRPAD